MIFLPTLDRVDQVKEFLIAYKETESKEPGWIVTDKQDYERHQSKYDSLELPKNWTIKVTQAVTMGDKSRELWPEILEQDVVMILNDDHRPRTKNWDQKVRNAINGTNIIFTNDGPTPDKPWNAPNRICGAIAFSQKVLKALGFMFPKGVQHLFSDDVWGIVSNKAQCTQGLMDVCVEHVHAYNNPNLQDDTFLKINGENAINELKESGACSGGFWQTDKEAFTTWLKEDAQDAAQRVLDIQPKMGIMVATPSHDGDCSMDYATGLADTVLNMAQRGIYFELAKVVGSSLIPHARNSLTDLFLKSRCQKLLFVDSDQSWGAMQALSLFSSPRRIVAGITPHKRFPINLNFEPLPDDHKYFKDLNNKSNQEFETFIKERADKRGEIEVNRSGTGFIMIDRSVFEIMKEHVTEYFPFDGNDQVKHREYFWMGAHEGRYRGEDWHFVALAKKLKIPIYINTNVLLGHKGQFTWLVDRAM